MAEGRVFENVAVSVLQEDGSKIEKYSGPVNVHLNYDPHGLSCTVIRGGECVLDIPIESKTECCRMGTQSYVLFNLDNATLFKFFVFHIFIQGKIFMK